MSTKAWIGNYKIIDYAVWLFVFLIPWQARWIISLGQINGGPWEYGTQAVYATEVLLAVILVWVIGKWIVGTRLIAFLRPAWPIFLLLIWAGLSVFWAGDKGVALIHWRFLVEAGVVFLFIRDAPPGPSVREKIKWAIIISAAIQAIIAITQFLAQSVPASTVLGMASQWAGDLGPAAVEVAGGRWLRGYGMFPHPNILGAWLVLGLVTIASLWREKKFHPERSEGSLILRDFAYKGFLASLGKNILFIILLFGLLTTFSRSAWLGFAVFSVFYFLSSIFTKNQRVIALKVIGLSLMTIAVFAAIFPDPFLSRFSQNRLETKSNLERVGSWQEGWQIIKNHPFLGVGIGNYGLAVRDEIKPNQPAWYYQPVHNVPLLIWAELGLVGLALMALWLYGYTANKLTTVLLPPLVIIAFLDHYLWSLYPGLMILAVWLGFSHHPLPPPRAGGDFGA